MGQKLGLRKPVAAMTLSGALAAQAATSTLTISGPAPSLPVGTITVVDATPPVPFYSRAEFLGPVVTLLLGLLAAFLAFKQIDRQRRNTSELQVEAKRNEFKLEIYREFAKALDAEHFRQKHAPKSA